MSRKRINLKRKLSKFKKARERAMREIANNSVNFFKVTSFDKQGFVDKKLEKWEKLKTKKKRGSKILVKTGRGRQSIHAKSITGWKVVIVAGANYMKYHNTGTNRLPQRKFMGRSRKLNVQNKKIIKKHLSNL